jgi:glycosyltransferase involved in cell wall biosynthesis
MPDLDPQNRPNRSLVVVAGSGRSGTSLCSGLLNRLGFHIPQPEVRANVTNPSGFGEPQWAISFHQRWLDAADVSKEDARPSASAKMVRVGKRPKVRKELAEWLADQFAESDRVVVKDPRLTWFTPLYAEVAAELGASFAVVTMVRHPVETTRSRELAYGSGLSDTARMTAWVNMMLSVELATRPYPRALISYGDLLADWRGTFEAAGRTLGIDPVADASPEQLGAADALVDPSLYRATSTWDESNVPAQLKSLAEAVYVELETLTSGPDSDPDPAALDRLDALRAQYGDFYASCEQITRTSIVAARREQRRKDTEHAATLERELRAATRQLNQAETRPSPAVSPASSLERVRAAGGRAARGVKRRLQRGQPTSAPEGQRSAAERTTNDGPRRKIYLVTVWLTGSGGIARAVTTLANSLARSCDVEIISVERGRDDPVFPLDPRVKVSHLVDQREDSVRRSHDEAFSEHVVELIHKRLAEIPSGVVIANRPVLSSMAAEACRDNVVVIAREHSAFAARTDEQTESLRMWGDRLDAVVTLTESDQSAHTANMQDTSAEVVLIPNALPWPLKGTKGREDKVIVAAGALVPNKGQARLIEAFVPVARAHPDWQLHVYGQGRLKDDLQQQVEQLGLSEQIHIKGYTERFERVLSRAAIFAHTAYYEAFGLVLVEAMSKSVPVVVFDCPSGPRHVVDDGVTGFLVPDGDIAAFTRALRELVEDDEKRHAMGQAGREAVARYGPQRVADEWLALIDTLVARRASIGVGGS